MSPSKTTEEANERHPEFALPQELRDAILRYLLARPMGEVEVAVHALRGLRKLSHADPS